MSTTRLRSTSIFLAVAIALPLVGAAVMSWSLADRLDRADEIPVAIVNNDEIITGDRPMAAGRALSDALVHPQDEAGGLGWIVTDEEDAADGLESGEYFAVLTIPEDFSAAVLSVSGDDPVSTELLLETDPAASATAALASRVVTETAAATLGRDITEAFVSTTIGGFGEVSTALSASAEGADQLADGAAGLSEGAAQVDEGTARLADGLAQLSAGTGEIAAGTDRLAAGATTIAGGATELARGAGSVASGTSQVADATVDLAAGSQQLADALADIAASCPAVSPQYCDAVAQASQSAQTLASSSTQVAAGAVTTASGAATLASSSGDYAAGASEFAAGATAVASGADGLVSATTEAARGAGDLAAATTQLSAGAGELATGARELADGLGDGAASVPTYTEEEIEQLSTVVTEPVTVSSEATSSGSGTLPAAIAAIVLWLAAIVTLAVRSRAGSSIALSSPASNFRLTVVALRRRMAIAALQGVAVTAVIAAFGFELDSVLRFGALSVLAAMSFTVLLTGLQALLRNWSLVAFAALTLVQTATLSTLLPLQTAPPWIAALDPFLPVSAFTRLAAELASGAPLLDPAAAVTCLLAWTVIGAALAFVGIRGRRAIAASSAAFTAAGGMRGRMAA